MLISCKPEMSDKPHEQKVGAEEDMADIMFRFWDAGFSFNQQQELTVEGLIARHYEEIKAPFLCLTCGQEWETVDGWRKKDKEGNIKTICYKCALLKFVK